MAKIILVWGLWGPYHCHRLQAFRKRGRELGHDITGISLFSGSRVNQWRVENLPEGVVHINLGSDETCFPLRQLHKLALIPRTFQADVALLPSYDHWSLVINTAARFSGGKVVMMNETHGGTARARGWKAALKRRVVSRFDAALVGGAPQTRYFASLGLPEEKIFTGYDAIDNDYFASQSDEIKTRAATTRARYDLPEHYFLSLGRFVAKKNLSTLIQAYHRFLEVDPQTKTHLVMVGSGEEESKLHSLCRDLRLPMYDKTAAGIESQKLESGDSSPGVHFYGFRRIEENPAFYALADAFILPSLWEEWGLVVNEAMACGLPVIVSETAGCAEDLLEGGSGAGLTQAGLEHVNRLKLARRVRENGLIFDPRSSDELAGTMSLLDSCPDLRRRMGQTSQRVVEKFSCRNFAENALRAVNAALGVHRPGLKALPVAGKT